MRWIWIDRFTEFEPGKSATAVKALSQAEDHFAEHFPGYPVMPACLMLEGLAQTGGILVGEARNFQEKVILAKIQNAKFHRDILAGEMLTYQADMLNLREEGGLVAGKITCGTDLVAEAEIFFAHLDQNRSQQVFGNHNFVFSGELANLLGMAKLVAGNTRELPPANSPVNP